MNLSNFILTSAANDKYKLKPEIEDILSSYKTITWNEMCQNSRLYMLQPGCFKDIKLSEVFP